MAASERRAVQACPTVGDTAVTWPPFTGRVVCRIAICPCPARPVHCRVCTILIGNGFEERRPIPLTNGRGYICWQCYASLRRQTCTQND